MPSNHERFSLADKVIAVTGGSKRYGYYFCDALTEAGATVVLTSRDRSRAEETAAKFSAQGRRCFGLPLDQGDDESIEEFVSSIIRDHGRIDVLVNSARTIPAASASTVDRRELDKVFTVNAVGLILLTRRVVDEMKKARRGNIINIGSIYGLVGQDLSIYQDPENSMSLDYPVQKGGVVAYTRQLATCLARFNIRANCLSLGGLSDGAPTDPTFQRRYLERTPLARMAVGEDVKGPIIFLASDASAYMTGANLVVDGGWTAW